MLKRSFGLATDLYEMTMAAAYFDSGLAHRSIFELFVRRLPAHRSYLIAAGLQQAIDYLSSLRFTQDEVDYLRQHPAFKQVSREFFDYLAEFRFTGDVWAVPEGTMVFAMEPLVRVSAPAIEAQVVETFLLSTINFQTMIASKAARIVTAASDRSVIEFGTRRAHGSEAGLLAARAAYIGGCAGTSNVEAGFTFGIPTFGTLAHSFVMSFDTEDEAFRAFLKVFPASATVLVDTYDTLAAVERLARDYGATIPAVRLDSGDLLSLSLRVRRVLDEAGMRATKIFASSDLNEHRIADLISRGAPIDAFGVGTELATSYDAPALPGVYKLVAIEQDGRMKLKTKLSADKATYPGAKQVWRLSNEAGGYVEDLIAMEDESKPSGAAEQSSSYWKPLLVPYMREGRVIEDSEAQSELEAGASASTLSRREAALYGLNLARDRAIEEMRRLPQDLLALDATRPYPVRFSQRLMTEKQRLEEEIARANE